MNAVTTHDRCDMPPRSAAIRGRAVLTMFWSSAASTIASSAPAITVRNRGAGALATRGDGCVPKGGKEDAEADPAGRTAPEVAEILTFSPFSLVL